MRTSRRDVLTEAAGLAAAGALALPVSVPAAQAALGEHRPYLAAAELREVGLRLAPSRMIIDCDLVQQAIDALFH
jgi:hypothetical protein